MNHEPTTRAAAALLPCADDEHEWIDVGPDEPGGCGRYCEVCGTWAAPADLVDYDEGH